ncbi:hypothetical protein CP97_02725 [Aurantiacibacter atlanticus]|uniref:Secreted protein n=1 Tax=Aurantiacibacter atlanticus TaxID=1648404 RepID=A0A0H4V9C2_9SPHN|nr:hypothetical protein [Aurantiacibacter atlanticus]AKQ41187.1 hypothetical protein CP97_02725 [Aurantiacibacter atlanticus]
MTVTGLLVGALATVLSAVNAAQNSYGPSIEFEGDPDTPITIVEPESCEDGVQLDGTIVVCRKLVGSERYMSPLPKPTDPQIRVLPGFDPPPCENHLLSFCGGFGGSSRPPITVDLKGIPEPLTHAEAAAISAAD